MTEIRFVYVTTPSLKMAEMIATELVKERLAACANIIPQMESIYEWQGRLEHMQECVLLLKTTKERLDQVIQRVRDLHEYDCPCIVSLVVNGGSDDFLNWIQQQTKDLTNANG